MKHLVTLDAALIDLFASRMMAGGPKKARVS